VHKCSSSATIFAVFQFTCTTQHSHTHAQLALSALLATLARTPSFLCHQHTTHSHTHAQLASSALLATLARTPSFLCHQHMTHSHRHAQLASSALLATLAGTPSFLCRQLPSVLNAAGLRHSDIITVTLVSLHWL